MVQIRRSSKKIIKKPAPPAKSGKKVTGKLFGKEEKQSPSTKRRTGSSATGFSGLKGFGQAKQEKKKSEDNRRRRNLPWRMWIRPGESAEVILLDEKPFFMYEHDLGKDAQGNKVFERCIKETGHCPLCSKTGREGYYVMMCTALDKRGYRPKAGSTAKPQKVVKRLFPVKQAQIPKFERFYTRNGESLRGIHLNCARDGEKESVIGGDIEYVGKVSDIALKKYGAELITPVDYEQAFPMLSEDEMKKRYGVKGPAGSADFNDDDEDEDDDDASSGWD